MTEAVVGGWSIDRRANRIRRAGEERRVEPKVMDLLALLAARPNRVLSHEEIRAALWPSTTVNADSLARCVFKLRRVLDDDPDDPQLVETIPKRGYRLRVGGPANVPDGEAEALKRRAEAFYFQFTRADNEQAIALYERILEAEPGDAAAMAGLANGLAQRAIRWLGLAEGAPARQTLKQALACGVLQSAPARTLLDRAQTLAQAAAAADPQDARALRAAGLVMAARGELDRARGIYERAVALDPGDWGALISLADLDGLRGRDADALARLEQAYALMTERYDRDVALVRPWHAELGVLIAERRAALGDSAGAAAWHRRVLEQSPLHEAATLGLARILLEAGDRQAARSLCEGLVQRIGPSSGCERLLQEIDAA